MGNRELEGKREQKEEEENEQEQEQEEDGAHNDYQHKDDNVLLCKRSSWKIVCNYHHCSRTQHGVFIFPSGRLL